MSEPTSDSGYFGSLVQKQRQYFQSQSTLSYDFRIAQLKKLLELVQEYEDRILAAVYQDLGKSKFEAWGVETGLIQAEVQYAIRRLRRWMKPKPLRTPYFHFYSKSYIQSIPYGVTLVIAPWNYPFLLALRPAIGAIAAGNTCIIKPSEVSMATTQVIVEMINNHFPPEYFHVVNTGASGTQELLRQKFDFIFFTGGARIGTLVYEAAAKQLTPVALELGGKNPCMIDQDINLKITADRITWGKFSNAGQTCVAPDYLIVHEKIKDKLVDAIVRNIQLYFGNELILSQDYGRIINETHFDRLAKLIAGSRIIYGGEMIREQKFIGPTLVEVDSLDEPVMREEVFGPVLPILTYRTTEEALRVVERNPDPLVFYIFTNNRNLIKRIAAETSSGDLVINDVVLHFGHLNLPIGGKGTSGIGKYQGKFSFEEFSHPKSVMHRSFYPDLSVRYPPYTDKKLNFLKTMFRWFISR